MVRIGKVLRGSLGDVLSILNPPPRNTTVLLGYHSVGGEGPRATPVPLFENQMAYLAEHFRCVRMKDLRQHLAGPAPSGNLACVTFDDGHRDHHERAAPILREYGISATFFVPTGFVGEFYPSSSGEVPAMNAGQLRELREQGHEIGSHSVHHARLTSLESDALAREVTESRRDLEELLDAEVVSFAYPYGDHDGRVRRCVREAGYRSSVTTEERLVGPCPDWYRLPRVRVNRRVPMRMFRLKTSRMLPVWEGLKRIAPGGSSAG